MQFGFHQVTVVGKIVQNSEKIRLYTKGETIHKTIPKNTQNKSKTQNIKSRKQHTKQKSNHKKNIKKT
jgi:hypothetical protein